MRAGKIFISLVFFPFFALWFVVFLVLVQVFLGYAGAFAGLFAVRLRMAGRVLPFPSFSIFPLCDVYMYRSSRGDDIFFELRRKVLMQKGTI